MLRRLPVILTLLIFVSSAPALRALFLALSRIDNSPADAERYAPRLSALSLLAVAILLALTLPAALRTAPPTTPPLARRTARFTVAALAAAFILWWLPIPFAPTRYVALVLLLFAAWRCTALALRASLPAHPRPDDPAAPPPPLPPPPYRWAGPASALAAATLAALTLLLAKLNNLAWAFAID